MLCQLYEVYPDEALSANNAIEASHKWGLPGVQCSLCHETWARTGVAYPSVDLLMLHGEEQYRRLWPVSLGKLNERRKPVLELIPDGTVPPPGTEFGPLVGRAYGTFGDFAWANSWTLLAQPQALDKLRKDEVKLPKSVPTLIEFARSNVQMLFELELEPRTLIAPSAFPSPLPQCNACGRVQAKMPAKITIQGSSVPSHIDIFRDRLFPTLILASDHFFKAIKRLQLTGLEFREVQVV